MSVFKGLYIELYHGREKDQELDDWGSQGPVFGPFPYFHTTYACGIKFGEVGHSLHIVGDLVYYDGLYYGDWSVFDGSIMNGRTNNLLVDRIALFDQKKADLN